MSEAEKQAKTFSELHSENDKDANEKAQKHQFQGPHFCDRKFLTLEFAKELEGRIEAANKALIEEYCKQNCQYAPYHCYPCHFDLMKFCRVGKARIALEGKK